MKHLLLHSARSVTGGGFGLELLIGLMVLILLVFIIIRQMLPRQIKRKPVLYLVLMAVGILEISRKWSSFHWSAEFVGLTLLGSLVLPVLFGWWRAKTYHYWLNDDAVVMRRGFWLTLLLWLVNLALHFGLQKLDASGAAVFMTFELGLTLLVQRELAYRIAARRFPDEIGNGE